MGKPRRPGPQESVWRTPPDAEHDGLARLTSAPPDAERSVLKIESVQPIGTRTVQTLHGPVEMPRYPDAAVLAGILIRDIIRSQYQVTPSEAAEWLGVHALEVYALMRGALTCDAAEFQRLMMAGSAAARERAAARGRPC